MRSDKTAGASPNPTQTTDLSGWLPICLFAITLAAYFPALRGGFIWNDNDYVTKASLRSLSGLLRIWTEPGATEQYYPVLHTFFWIQHALCGDAPFAYHLVNVLLHALNACLVAVIMRRLAIPGAWLAALVFALHPVCVESVAWVSEQKNSLSTAFFLAAIWSYLCFNESNWNRWYRVSAALFLLALGTKSLTATLPAALLVITWWRMGRIDWRQDVVPLLPWFLIGAIFSLFTAWVESAILLARGPAFALSGIERSQIAARAVWFYLGKIFWPVNLTFIYPRWEMHGPTPAGMGCIAITAVILAALFALRRRSRAPLAAALLFVGLLFPVLGFFNLYAYIYSFVADHWQYLPSIAIISVVAAALAALVERGNSHRQLVLFGLATLGGLALLVLTFEQCEMYRDVTTFYRTIIARNPDCWMAHNNLGNELRQAGRSGEALPHYQRAVDLKPDFALGYVNIAATLLDTGNAAAAIMPLRHALALEPDNARAHYNLAGAYSALGNIRANIRELHEALLSAPDFPAAETNLGAALVQLGQLDEAMNHYATALRLDPGHAPTLYNLGNTLLAQGRLPEAIGRYEQALNANPALAEAHVNCAVALGRSGRSAEAIEHLRSALVIRPRFAEAHYLLALTLREQRNLPEARRHYDLAREADSRLPPLEW